MRGALTSASHALHSFFILLQSRIITLILEVLRWYPYIGWTFPFNLSSIFLYFVKPWIQLCHARTMSGITELSVDSRLLNQARGRNSYSSCFDVLHGPWFVMTRNISARKMRMDDATIMILQAVAVVWRVFNRISVF